MSNHIEREFKLRAKQPVEIAAIDAALLELGASSRHNQTVRHTDTYFDDARATLLREGIGLRMRAANGRCRLTFKSRKQSAGGLFVRDEIEVDWPHQELPNSAAELPAELRVVVEPLLRHRKLQPLQVLSVHREIRMLTDGNADLCELAIDYVVAKANGHCATFQEIELEFQRDEEKNQQLASDLRGRLPVDFASQDKPSHAAALLGIELPSRESDEERARTHIRSSIPAQLQTLLDDLHWAEAQRTPLSLDEVRELQAQVQRIDSLVASFAELWPKETLTRMRSLLHGMHKRTADVAALDTLVASLEEHLAILPMQLVSDGQETATWILSMRDTAALRLQQWLRSDEFQATQRQLEDDFPRTGESKLANENLIHEAPLRIAEGASRLRKLMKKANLSDPVSAGHSLIERVRRVHDLTEHFAELLHRGYSRSCKSVAKVRRHLEAVANLNRVGELLMQWILTPMTDSDQRARRAAVLGLLVTQNASATDAARAVAAKAIGKMDRKKVWRRFERD